MQNHSHVFSVLKQCQTILKPRHTPQFHPNPCRSCCGPPFQCRAGVQSRTNLHLSTKRDMSCLFLSSLHICSCVLQVCGQRFFIIAPSTTFMTNPTRLLEFLGRRAPNPTNHWRPCLRWQTRNCYGLGSLAKGKQR